MGLVLDTGGMIAFDRGDRRVGALVEATRRRRAQVVTSSACVAQAWRGGGPRQALLARLLRGVDEHPLGPTDSLRVGALCAQTATNDVVDAHVALLAGDPDIVLTSDADDIEKCLRATGSTASITRC